MDKINFNQTGGFPLTTNILNAMQNAYNIFNSLGNLVGNYTIISGCEETGNNVGDGVVYINGELLPFKGGIKISKVRIVEDTESKQFEDGQTKTVLFKRFAQFGTGVNAIDWSKFARVNPLLKLMERVKALEDRPYFEVGMVLIWNRPASEIPAGFEPYTEMAGRTPIGRDSNYVYATNTDLENYKLNELGYEGGVREHKLTESELPKFKYEKRIPVPEKINDVDRGSLSSKFSIDGVKEHKILVEFGNDKAHPNMSPYRIVEFIKYVGV